MNKLTKLLSVFVLAGVIGTGVAGVAGCKKSKGHTHKYTYTVDVEDATKHNGVCDCGKDPIIKEGHVDNKNNETDAAGEDGKCDLCGATIQQQSTEVTVTGVTVTAAGSATSVAKEGTLQLSAAVAGTGNPAQTVTWATSDDSKATVSTTGLVTGVAEGTVTITATSTVDTTKKGTINLTVTAKGTVDPGPDVGGDKDTIPDYATLVAKSNKLYNNDFGTAFTAPTFAGYGTAGVYTDKEGKVAVKDGVLEQKAYGANDADKANYNTIIDFGPLSADSTLEGYVEVKVNATGSSWNVIQFRSGISNALVIGAGTDKSKIAYAVGSGITEKPDGKTSQNVAGAVVTDIAFAETTTYKIYFKFNLETGAVVFDINGTTVEIADANIKAISGIYLATGNSGQRVVTLDNLVFCGTEVSAAEYAPTALVNLDTEYAKYKLEGADATHSTNKTYVTEAYEAGKTAINAADTLSGVQQAYATAVAAMKDVLADADIASAITAAKASLAEKFPAANYSIDFAAGDDDAIYNNKKAYEDAIAAIEDQIDGGATKKSALDKIVEDAVISVEDNATKLAAKKAAVTGAEGVIATYKATETAAIETTHATQYAAIAAARAAAVTDVNAATTDTIAKVNAIITELKSDIDGALLETQETLEDSIARYKQQLEAKGTAEKAGLDETADAAKIAAVNAAVTAGKDALDAVNDKANVKSVYDAHEAKVLMAIPKFVAKTDLLTSKNEALEEIHGTNEEENTAISAVNTAYDEGVEAIDAAADADAVTEKLETAQGKIADAMTKLKNTKYAITVKKSDGTTISSSDLKIGYGSALEIDESKLTIADNEKLDKLYNTCTGGVLSDEITTEVKVYGDVTVYVSIIEVKRIQASNAFKYSAIVLSDTDKANRSHSGSTAGDNIYLDSNDFVNDNSFLTVNGVTYNQDDSTKIASSLVTWRKSNNVIENKDGGLSFTVGGASTVTIKFSSTGGTNESRLGLQNESGAYIKASKVDSAIGEITTTEIKPAKDTTPEKTIDNIGAYKIEGTTGKEIEFTLKEAGTYTIVCPSDLVDRGARIYALSVVEDYKVDLDVTVNWGGVVKKYYHTDAIVAPAPTGLADNEEPDYWYIGVDDEEHKWVDGSTLPAGEYTYTLKKKTVAAVDSVTLTASATEINIGGSGVTLTAVAKDADENVLERTPSWSVGDYAYAEVVDGVLTLKTGATAGDTITVTATVGSKSDSVEITVKAANKVKGAFTPASLNANTELDDSDEQVVSIKTNAKVALKAATATGDDGKEFNNANMFRLNAVIDDDNFALTVKATRAATVTVYVSTAKTTNFRDTFKTTITTSSNVPGHTYSDIKTTESTYDKVNVFELYKIELVMDANEVVTISWKDSHLKTAVFVVNYEYASQANA